MPDWPVPGTFDLTESGCYSTSIALMGLNQTAAASVAWPTANMAIFVPMRIASPVMVYKMVVGAGATAAGNFDVGIYDRNGNRRVSSGSTAKGSSVEHVLDVADTWLGPGLYYLAMSANGTNNYIMLTPTGTAPVPLQKARLYGTLEAASAFALPDPVTMVARTGTGGLIPAIAAYFRPY
jgi:hypothetical protein